MVAAVFINQFDEFFYQLRPMAVLVFLLSCNWDWLFGKKVVE